MVVITMHKNKCLLGLALLFISFFTLANTDVNSESVVIEKPKSKMEIGAGAFALNLPHYLGSDQSDAYVVPFPYFYYLDDKYKVDRNQFTGKIWQDNHFYLDISASGGVKVNSDDNTARRGMDDLDWVFELGPSIKYYLQGDPQASDYFYLEFFTRKAAATDFKSMTNVGWRYGPSVSYQKHFSGHALPELLAGHGAELELTVRANVNFSDDRYLNYYYGVPERFISQSRVAFDSDGGYAGSDISAGLTYKVNQWWIGGFARYYNLSGAEYIDSPLVKQDNNWALGFGVAWIFYQR